MVASIAFLLAGTGSAMAEASVKPEPARPNVVMILVDDMGWSDIGAYGGEIRTPHLDRLAEQGVRFTRCYNTAKCFPSRAALLTGVYAQSSGMASRPAKIQYAATVGEVLRKAGYHTLAVGKHHGKDNLFDRGFDRYYGLRDGVCNHFNPGLRREGEPEPANRVLPRIWVDDEKVFETTDPDYQHYFPPGFYSTDAFTEKALEFLDEVGDSQKPFFLYLAYTAPHDPLQAWPEDIAKYKGIYDAGFASIRLARYQRQLNMGLIDAERYPLSPPTHRDWNSLSDAEKADQARRMQVYAAMIDRLDQGIGRILDRLKALGVRDNTLILFASDNGASHQVVEVGTGEIGTLARYASQKQDWANVSNTPFRLYKTYPYEGGINTPLIAHWPKGIQDPGRIEDTPVHFIDFMPTFLELTGAVYPSSIHQQPVTPLAGISFADVLENRIQPRERTLFWKWRQGEALFDGRYKLVRFDSTRWEVYDTSRNRTETERVHDGMDHLQHRYNQAFNNWLQQATSSPRPLADPAGLH
jgi:arylsulfatase